jgi:xanthine dehydrogenase YagS FAD-binding subunit
MQAFEYLRATDVDQAVAIVTANAAASYLAGGTTQIDLMKEGVVYHATGIRIRELPITLDKLLD